MTDFPVSRRTLVASMGLAGATLAGAAPALATDTIGVTAPAGGATPPPRAEWVYDATVQLLKEVPHGTTLRGKRFRVPIIGGTFAGPKLSGTIISGGYDWQLLREDGYWEISADYFMETSDGAAIHVINNGLWFSPTGDWPAAYAISTPQFEAPDGPYAWLNQRIFTGTIGPAGTAENPGVQLSIFQLMPGQAG